MTRFTLIIPFHNTQAADRSAYLDELLESLPDRPDLEILLVDDHSELAYQSAHPFDQAALQILTNGSDRRFAGTARNTGLENASGDIVFFADSDDRFVPGVLDQVLDFIAEDSDADIHLAHSTSFRPDGTRGDRHLNTERILADFERHQSTDALVRYHAPWGKFIRRSFIEKHSLRFGGSRVANDVLFGVSLALAAPKARVVDHVLYEIRQGNPSLTSDQGKEAVRTRLRVAREVHGLMCRAGRGELRAPLHYHFRRYALSHPDIVAAEFVGSLLRGERIASPPLKMFGTLMRRMRSRS